MNESISKVSPQCYSSEFAKTLRHGVDFCLRNEDDDLRLWALKKHSRCRSEESEQVQVCGFKEMGDD